MTKTYTLLRADGRAFESPRPGTLGGWRPGKIYGSLDCPNALKYIEGGTYARSRVFFADEATAVAAGYRPCFFCKREEYVAWKAGAAV